MTRKQIFSFIMCVSLVTLLGLVILALSPLYLPVILINPKLTNTPQEFVMGKVTRQMTQFMFRGNRLRRVA